MNIHVHHGEIQVVAGDITDQDTAAVVNAANNHLWMGGGVAGALKKRGGETIETEAVALGPIEVGSAVITGAGTLAAIHVIHAALMGQDLHTDESKVRAATRAALALASRHGIESVSLPALGTGVGAFSIHHCARIMIEEAVRFLMEGPKTKIVRFVLIDDDSKKVFDEELRLQFSAKRHS
jgi:O-acetyl-ADP-ribose deacetylase (regulator of RNase III)